MARVASSPWRALLTLCVCVSLCVPPRSVKKRRKLLETATGRESQLPPNPNLNPRRRYEHTRVVWRRLFSVCVCGNMWRRVADGSDGLVLFAEQPAGPGPVTTIRTKPVVRDIDADLPLKEQAVDAVLVRWNYTDLQWPPPFQALDHPDYAPLEGMPGVYIGIKNDAIGVLQDRRDMSRGVPTFNYLITLPAPKLQVRCAVPRR